MVFGHAPIIVPAILRQWGALGNAATIVVYFVLIIRSVAGAALSSAAQR